MITPKEIKINRRNEMQRIEKAIDERISTHFKLPRTVGARFQLKDFPMTENEIKQIVAKYTAAGWAVVHQRGCEDRPCAEPWNYIEFNLPT